jgi:hypothetical protein
MAKKLVLEERKHRQRLAQIWRLREIAGQSERIGQLDELLAKENQRFHRWLEQGRAVMGDRQFEALMSKLEQGRRQSVKHMIKDGQQPGDAPGRGQQGRGEAPPGGGTPRGGEKERGQDERPEKPQRP